MWNKTKFCFWIGQHPNVFIVSIRARLTTLAENITFRSNRLKNLKRIEIMNVTEDQNLSKNDIQGNSTNWRSNLFSRFWTNFWRILQDLPVWVYFMLAACIFLFLFRFQALRFVLTSAGKMTDKLSIWNSLSVAERSEAKCKKRSFASIINILDIFTRSFPT